MPFPPDEPGYQYTPPQDFHEGLVYRVHGAQPDLGDYNHPADTRTDGLTPLQTPCGFDASYVGSGHYGRAFGAPDLAGTGALACAWAHASIGWEVDGTWDVGSFCVLTFDPSETRGSGHGSSWGSSTGAYFPSLPQSVSANAIISGWSLRPWQIYAAYTNQWMDDDALEAEVQAIDFPDGWQIEWEAYHPILVGFQVAPDENLTGTTGLRNENAYWLMNPTGAGWNYLGQSGGVGVWDDGSSPDGDELAVYSGGAHPWIDVPEEWLPAQNPDRFVCELVEPEDVEAAAIPLTLATENIYGSGGVPDNGSGGRENQTLAVRAIWRTPQYRFRRVRTFAWPNRLIQRPHDGYAGGGTMTYRASGSIQGSNRTIGASR